MQVQNRRRVLAFGRPPPAMDTFPGLEAFGFEVELLHAARQAAEPGRRTRLDPKHQLTLLVLQHAATHRRSEEHTSELQSLMRISYAVFCLKKKTDNNNTTHTHTQSKTPIQI